MADEDSGSEYSDDDVIDEDFTEDQIEETEPYH